MRLLALALAVVLAPDAAAQEKKAEHLRMALVNLRCDTSAGPDAKTNQAAIDANLKRHVWFVDMLAAEGAEFVGFPELSLNGYKFSKTMQWLRIDGPEIKAIQKKAIKKKIYISVGLALEDTDGKRWNAQIVIDPEGRIIGMHKKIWLTAEKGFVEPGTEHHVFDVKGIRTGIVICADGTDRKNLQALVDQGAKLIYGPHANTTGSTIAGWYKFRSAWAGPKGWIAEMKVHAALHNHAAIAEPKYDAPMPLTPNGAWASGAWFIGPDGATIDRMPPSTQRGDSKEYVLICDVPIPKK
ncbi:MAG: carbon-nitrogen hydrolase family protein [Gemmataceae bacterium]